MKRTAILVLMLLIVVGCTQYGYTPPAGDLPQPPALPDGETVVCSTNADCRPGGCSGQLCVPTSERPVITTCEFREEYACYQTANCGCFSGQCGWEQTAALQECIAQAR